MNIDAVTFLDLMPCALLGGLVVFIMSSSCGWSSSATGATSRRLPGMRR